MNTKSHIVYLDNIIEAIEYIQLDTEGHDFKSFEEDRQVQQLVERNLEIISEASRHLPDELKARWEKIPWGSIAGIGNKLRHDYQSIDVSILWNTKENDLEPLKSVAKQMRKYLEDSSQS